MLYSCKRFFPSLRAFPVASLPVAFFPAFIPLQMCLFHIPHLCNNYNPSWRKIVRLHPFSPASFSRPCQSLLPGRGKVIKSALKHKALFAPIFIDFGKYWPKFPPPSLFFISTHLFPSPPTSPDVAKIKMAMCQKDTWPSVYVSGCYLTLPLPSRWLSCPRGWQRALRRCRPPGRLPKARAHWLQRRLRCRRRCTLR